jgi:hypothetical protein
VDFADAASKEAAIAKATETTSEVEAECPWAARFGIAGTGEGIVWFPLGDHWGNADLFFKTKGDKHKKTKRNAARPQIAPEMLESVEAFVAFAVTENRLEQGLEAIQEAGHSVEMSSMPHFLKWMGQDVARECAAELEVNGLKWKDVSKAVTNRCRSFFITSVQTLS